MYKIGIIVKSYYIDKRFISNVVKLMNRLRVFSVLVFVSMLSVAIFPVILASPDENSAPIFTYEETNEKSNVGEGTTSGFFTENLGQWDNDLDLIASTPFGRAGFSSGCSYLDIRPERGSTGFILKYEFVGSDQVEPKGQDLLPHYNNYFYGDDKTTWYTEVENYHSVVYEDLWDSIDLRYYFTKDGLKYDLILHPGADPDDIKIKLSGMKEMIVEEDNIELLLPSGGPSITDNELKVCYGDDGTPITASFSRISSNIYGFELETYDSSREAVIDPLIYSSFIGGSNYDVGRSVEVDSSGNAYVTGRTQSSNFPTTSGAYNTSYNSNGDVFITKMNSAGSSLVYSTFVGGSYDDHGYGIDIDSSGNAYVTGYTSNWNWSGGNQSYYTFPTTSGAFDESHNGDNDVFVIKLNPSGSSLLYSTVVGSNRSEDGRGIVVDSNGNAYVTGSTDSSNFPTTSGAYQKTSSGSTEAFVFKLNSTGAKMLYSTFLGGDNTDRAYDIKVDTSGNAYVTGSTRSSDFPTTSGSYDQTHNSNYDVFVTKLNSTGKGLVHSTFVGGGDRDYGYSIDIDSSGNAYVTGKTYYYYSGGNNSTSSNFPMTQNAYDRFHNGNYDAFAFKLNSAGTSLTYSTFIGGSSRDSGEGISVDGNGTAYITGYTSSYNFPTTWGSQDTSQNGNDDIFVVKLSSSGSRIDYSTFVGGSSGDVGYDVEYHTSGHVFVTGVTYGSGFPVTNGSYDTSSNGRDDVILFKLDFTISAPPMAPTGLNAKLRSDHVKLTWRHPTNNGTSPLIGYRIYRYMEGGNGSGNRSSWFTNIATIGPVTSWDDHGIILGNYYYYYIKAYNLVGDSPPSSWAEAGDHLSPSIVKDHTPDHCFSGETLTFNVEVKDDVLVKGVDVMYWHPGEWIWKAQLVRADDHNWTYTIDIDIDAPTSLNYYFTAEDFYENSVKSNSSRTSIWEGKPVFAKDLTPITGTTGELHTFMVEVLDNSAVGTVKLVYWYAGLSPENISMTHGGGDLWTYSISVEDTLSPIHYRFHAVDDLGHWNETGTNVIDIIDNDLPQLINDETLQTGTTGEEHLFVVEASDNIEILTVKLEHWFIGSIPVNQTIEERTLGRWNASLILPEDDLASLHYRFWLEDTSGNILKGPEMTIEILDNDPPEITSTDLENNAFTSISFKFSMEATDNIEVEGAWVEYWFGPGQHRNITMGSGADFLWHVSVQVPDTVEDLRYVFHVKDTSGNWEHSFPGRINVLDEVVPMFLEDTTPTETITGGSLTFEVAVTDNIEIRTVEVEYWYENEMHYTGTMTGTLLFNYTLDILLDAYQPLNYIFHAMDSSLNRNQTHQSTISIIDDREPTITADTTQRSAREGDRFTFSVFIDDNVGVDSVMVEYWFGDGEHTSLTMDGSNPFMAVIDLPDGVGQLNYLFRATDETGNDLETEVQQVEIEEKGTSGTGWNILDPTGGGDEEIPAWLWVLIVVVVIMLILTLVNILITLKRRRSPSQDANGNGGDHPPYPYGQPIHQQQPLQQGNGTPYPTEQAYHEQDPAEIGPIPENQNGVVEGTPPEPDVSDIPEPAIPDQTLTKAPEIEPPVVDPPEQPVENEVMIDSEALVPGPENGSIDIPSDETPS